ncbi:MAG TPA: helicase HerA-like domain-containing protein [Pyrinomonadaceae bacterium]|nr:helicase HerA-like domain-containing protein [Pyrinomonadaceae bacterium]
MRSLRIAANLTLPAEAVTQTFAILAKRGVGKTYTASVLTEELLKAGLQVVVADPIGVWWGLRASADGKREGLPIVVLGGDHGDAPLEVTAGETIASLIVEERLSVVLDLSRFRKGEQTRFMTDFCERLYHKNRAPLHLVLDEADAFAPQRPMKGQERLLGAVEDLVRRGRARGIGVTLVTQRSAVLNKDVLTQAEVLVALRTIAPQDRSAIDEWIKVHGTPEQREELMQSLPSLPIGTAWFWSPGWLDIFTRVKVRQRETYDSSATPKVGQKLQPPKKLAEVDLTKLRERIASTIEKAKASDPKELQKKIAELQNQIRQAENRKPKIERVEVPVLREGDIKELLKVVGTISATGVMLTTLAHEITSAISKTKANGTQAHAHVGRNGGSSHQPQQPRPQPKRAATSEDIKLSGGERKILAALAQYPQGRTKTQIAILTGYSHKGGAFNNYLSSLRSKGLVEGSGDNIRITADGLATGPYEALPSGSELIEFWMRQLGKAERSILTVLVDSYPRALSKEDVAALSGYEASGGGFNNALSKLRTLELIQGRGELRAADEFFQN